MSHLQTAKNICEKYTKEISYQHSNPRKGKGSRKRIVCISDLHAPFTRMDLVEEIITRYSGADILVMNGDLFDAHIISSFQKRKEVPFIDEYRIAGNLIMTLSKEFGQVILVDGNHEKRLSHLVAKLDPSVQFLFKSSPLAYIAEGKRFSETGKELDNVIMENVVYAGNINKASHWIKIGKAVFAHRLRGYARAPMANAVHIANWCSDRFDFDAVIVPHCFDENTEILTQGGWKNIDTILDTDKAATFNINSEEIEFENIQEIARYNNHKELIQFSNLDGLDIRVTPEHGMVYSTSHKESKQWHKKTAKELRDYPRFSVPVTGEEKAVPDAIVSDETLKLLGWIVSEGSITKGRIRIAQSDSPDGYVWEIKETLDKIGYKYHIGTKIQYPHQNYLPYDFYICKNDSQYLLQYLTEDKVFKWEFLATLSYRQRLVLIETACKGDGSKCSTNRWRAYYSKKHELADQIQYLATLCGIRTTISKTKQDIAVVHFSYYTHRTVSSTKNISYTGRTWCLTVNNGTLVARNGENKTVFITQNTHHLGLLPYKSRLLIEQGCLCLPLEYEEDGSFNRRPQELGYAVVELDKEGNVDTHNTFPVYLGTYSEEQ